VQKTVANSVQSDKNQLLLDFAEHAAA